MPHPNAKPLQCIFYSHPWTALLLRQIKVINFADSILIELSAQSILSQVIAPKRKYRHGLTPVLASHQPTKSSFMQFFWSDPPDIFQAAMQICTEMPAPLVFAPAPAMSAVTQIAALRVAANQASTYQQMIALIHYEEAHQFSGLYDYVDKFHILWDIADLPNLTLTELMQLLVTRSVTRERWGGFHLCQHPLRKVETLKEQHASFAAVIDAFLLKLQ